MRRLHYWIGLGSAAILLVTVVTGLLWAYAPFLYWEGGYMKRKTPVNQLGAADISLSPQEILEIAHAKFLPEAVITAVTLRNDFGVPLYEVTGRLQEKDDTILIDARSGAVLSPLTPELAEQAARQYISGAPPLRKAALLDEFHHRSGKVYEAVYRVSFDTEDDRAILLDAHSGKILEEETNWRRFHFQIMRLHQLNFFGFHKTLTIIPGTALLVLLGSGLWIGLRRKFRARPR